MINIEEFTFLSSDGQTRLHAMLWPVSYTHLTLPTIA